MDLFGEEEKKPELDAPLIGGAQDADDGNSHETQAYQGLLEPKLNPFLIGQEHAEEEFLQLYNSGRVPHALILSGAEGIGKSTLAYRIARFLLSRKEADPNQDALFGSDPGEEEIPENIAIAEDHPIFSRVASGGHSDLRYVGRKNDERTGGKKASVEVDEVRKVAPFLRQTAGEGDWRVVIIDDADTMNTSSQNAILKILEEPPKRTVILLIAHRLGALLPTIRSRARLLQMHALSPDAMCMLLNKQGHALSGQEFEALYTLSEGRIGYALSLMEGGGLELMAKIIALFEKYPSWAWSQIHLLSDEISRTKTFGAYEVFENVMLWIANQLTKAKARGNSIPSGPLSLDVFVQMKENSSLEDLTKICDKLREHFITVRRSNLDKRHAIMHAFSVFN